MKTFSKSLISELESQLEFIHLEIEDPLKYSEQAIKILISVLERLKTFSIKYKFPSKTEEIDFFREIKPQFASKLIYYNEIYNIESNKPFGAPKAMRKYYSTELDKLRVFFNDNLEFYRYFRKGNRYLDNKYFMRGKHDIRHSLDSFYFQADQRFSTSHDYKVARIMANDLLQVHIEGELEKLDNSKFPHKDMPITEKPLKWTGSKVGIIELIYALHTEGVFNHGAADLKEITGFFTKAFAIDLGQFHRTFSEITSRKSERTKFLNTLSSNLLKRMEDNDGK